MFCDSCGSGLQTGQRFCGHCGTALHAVEPPPTETTPTTVNAALTVASPSVRSGGAFSAFLVAGSVFLLLLLGGFVWPTLYRHENLQVGSRSYPVRINRLTGATEVFRGSSWVREQKRSTPRPLTVAELLAVTGRGHMTRLGPYGPATRFNGTIYNGTSLTLTERTVQLTLRGVGGKPRWTRLFSTKVSIPPLSSATFGFDAGEEGHGIDWSFAEILGRQ
jgi:hypothetical protein